MSSGWAAKQSTRPTRCVSGLNGLPACTWEAVKDSAFSLLDLGSGLREDVEDVPDDAEIRDLKDRRLGILVHGNDDLGCLHAGLLLDGAGDARGDVQLRGDGLAGLPRLGVVADPAGIRGRPGGTHGSAERICQLFHW